LAAYQEKIRDGKDFRSRAKDIRKDGSVFDVEVMGTAIEYRGKKYLAAVVRDISDQVASERDRAEAQQVLREAQATLEHRVKERTQELASILDVSRAVLSTLDLDGIFERVLDEVARVMPQRLRAILTAKTQRHRGEGFVRPELSVRAIMSAFRCRSPRLRETMLIGQPFIVRDAHSNEEPDALAFKALSARTRGQPCRNPLVVAGADDYQGEVLGGLHPARQNRRSTNRTPS
jgi:hypothetical protein